MRGTGATVVDDMDVWATYSCSLFVPSGLVHGLIPDVPLPPYDGL